MADRSVPGVDLVIVHKLDRLARDRSSTTAALRSRAFLMQAFRCAGIE